LFSPRDGFAEGRGSSTGCGTHPARNGANWLPAWMEARESEPMHGHRSSPALARCGNFLPQAALPNEGAVLRVFFGLWISGQMKLRRINGYRDIGGGEKAAAQKKNFMTSQAKCAIQFSIDSGTLRRSWCSTLS
jgi:hypothetical protein